MISSPRSVPSDNRAGSRDRYAPVVIFARLLAENRQAIQICERQTGTVKWLQRSQIKVEAGGIVGTHDLGDLGEVLRITLPAWLAESRGFGAPSGEGHEDLFGGAPP